jgi:hypothetical protein
MYLKKKSQENIEAARILAGSDLKLFASSVHCSYYSVFQLIKHTLYCKYQFNYNKQSNKQENDSHNFIIEKFSQHLRYDNIPDTIIEEKKRKIKKLKKNRVKADYVNIDISDNIAKKAIQTADEIKHFIESL